MVCQDLRYLLQDEQVPPAVHDRGLALLDVDMAEAIRFIQTGVGRLSNIIDALLRLSERFLRRTSTLRCERSSRHSINAASKFTQTLFI